MILVLVDQDRGELDQLSLRALTAARKLGQDVEAVVIGKEGAALAGIVGELFVEEVERKRKGDEDGGGGGFRGRVHANHVRDWK